MTRQQKNPSIRPGWTSAGLPHVQGAHRNLRTNPVDPSSLLTPKANSHYSTYCFMHGLLNSTDVWFCPPQCGLYRFRVQNKTERLSPVDPGISRGVIDVSPSRGYTPRNTCHRSITDHTQLAKLSFDRKSFLVHLTHTAQVYSRFFKYIFSMTPEFELTHTRLRKHTVYPLPGRPQSHSDCGLDLLTNNIDFLSGLHLFLLPTL